MGIFKPGLPLLRRVAGALLARGQYVPAVTRTGPNGQNIIVSEEVVEGQGALRSTTVQFGLGGIVASVTGIITAVQAEPFDLEVLGLAVAGLVTSAGAIWRHVRSWMPTRGMAEPVPRP